MHIFSLLGGSEGMRKISYRGFQPLLSWHIPKIFLLSVKFIVHVFSTRIHYGSHTDLRPYTVKNRSKF